MSGNIAAVLTPVGLLMLSEQVAPGNNFPWALVALGIGGGRVLAVGGYLIARFLAHHHSTNNQDQ